MYVIKMSNDMDHIIMGRVCTLNSMQTTFDTYTTCLFLVKGIWVITVMLNWKCEIEMCMDR